METSLALDHETTPAGDGYIVRALLKVTGDAPERAERVPLNLSIVLDRSGSMSGEPLTQAKHAAALLVRRLWPEDVVSVVAYDDEVETIAEPATGQEQGDLPGRIRGIQTRGCTNLSGGWLRGRELVAERRRDGAVNRVLLLTDGLANVGITDDVLLVGLCRTAAEHGITTTTIGFGSGYHEELLGRMAEAGGGSTYYIEHADQAPAVFAEEIEDLLSLSVQNLSIDLIPGRDARLTLVHHRYPSSDTAQGVRLQVGDLYARAPRMVLAEFLVSGGEADAPAAVAEVVVRGEVVTADGAVERREIHLPIEVTLAAGPTVHPEVRRELLLQRAARVREDARKAREMGDYLRASQELGEVAATLQEFGPSDVELREEAEDLQRMAHRFRRREVSESDVKYLYQRSYGLTRSKPGGTRPISRVDRADD